MRKAYSLFSMAIVALAPVLLLSGTAAQTQAPAATAKTVLTQALPDLRGKEVLMLTVEYPPAGISPSHRHNANTFVYVLEGSIVMAVAGGKETTLTAGQTFYESPTDIHSVSRNASKTQPAKFLVFMIKEQGAPATVPTSG
jgi:quercetin dioxygenase-like cupin family protein